LRVRLYEVVKFTIIPSGLLSQLGYSTSFIDRTTAMNQTNKQEQGSRDGDTDSLISAVTEQLTALLSVAKKSTALVLAEVRLAASSIVYALILVTLLILALLVTWITAIATVFIFLQNAGYGALESMAMLLALHVGICVLLVLLLGYIIQFAKLKDTRALVSKGLLTSSPSRQSTKTVGEQP